MEMVVVVAVISLLAVIVFLAPGLTRKSEALERDSRLIVSAFDDARASTLASKGAQQYGVHVSINSVTVFVGTTYSSSASSNIVSNLSADTSITAISLAGGVSDVVFQSLSGETSQNGTLTLKLTSSPSSQKTITIYGSGLVDRN